MKNILVVDDTALIRRRIKNILFPENFKVFESETGSSLLNDTFAEDFTVNDMDIILLDIYLKGENGFDILKYLTAKHPEVDVIIVSGENKRTNVTKAIQFGAKDFLAKPFDNHLLLKKLNRVINRKSKNREDSSSLVNTANELCSFNTNLILELKRSLRSKLPVSFIKINLEDIDENKRLLEIKDYITAKIRDIDQIYFLDSHQFCFILPLTDKPGLEVFVEKIKSIIKSGNNLDKNEKKSEEVEAADEELKITEVTFPDDIIDGDIDDIDLREKHNYNQKVLEKIEVSQSNQKKCST